MHVLHWQLQSLGGVFSILQIEQFEQDLAHMDMKKKGTDQHWCIQEQVKCVQANMYFASSCNTYNSQVVANQGSVLTSSLK